MGKLSHAMNKSSVPLALRWPPQGFLRRCLRGLAGVEPCVAEPGASIVTGSQVFC